MPRPWTVTDDCPDPVPVTDAEIDVFEQWFGDLSMNCWVLGDFCGCRP
jgi:hypothetical protein